MYVCTYVITTSHLSVLQTFQWGKRVYILSDCKFQFFRMFYSPKFFRDVKFIKHFPWLKFCLSCMLADCFNRVHLNLLLEYIQLNVWMFIDHYHKSSFIAVYFILMLTGQWTMRVTWCWPLSISCSHWSSASVRREWTLAHRTPAVICPSGWLYAVSRRTSPPCWYVCVLWTLI